MAKQQNGEEYAEMGSAPQQSTLLIPLLYGVGATSTSIATAYADGRLYTAQLIMLKSGNVVTVWPFIVNFSTLIDFFLLNPLTIYLIIWYMKKKAAFDGAFQQKSAVPLYHQLGAALLSGVIGLAAMVFYMNGFSQTFDATLIPDNNGVPTITNTGIVVAAWTALFIAIVFYVIVMQGFHVHFIISLKWNDLKYDPFHPDKCGGLKELVSPSLYFVYAMMVLLAIIAVFMIHDKVIFSIRDSNRFAGFVAYIFLILPLFFLPIYHIHKIMQSHSDIHLDKIREVSKNVFGTQRPYRLNDIVMQENTIRYINEYKKAIAEFPVWPLPLRLSFAPIGSLLVALGPVISKLVNTQQLWGPHP